MRPFSSLCKRSVKRVPIWIIKYIFVAVTGKCLTFSVYDETVPTLSLSSARICVTPSGAVFLNRCYPIDMYITGVVDQPGRSSLSRPKSYATALKFEPYIKQVVRTQNAIYCKLFKFSGKGNQSGTVFNISTKRCVAKQKFSNRHTV